MLEMLTDMFGKECIGKMIKGNNISVTVDENVALVNVESLVGTVLCVGVCGRGGGGYLGHLVVNSCLLRLCIIRHIYICIFVYNFSFYKFKSLLKY